MAGIGTAEPEMVTFQNNCFVSLFTKREFDASYWYVEQAMIRASARAIAENS
jgi:hypothetical protein